MYVFSELGGAGGGMTVPPCGKSRACGPVTYRSTKPHNASCRTEDSLDN